jgi:branched-chain amino acid transport system permease protein
MQDATVSPSMIVLKPRRPLAWIGKGFLILLAVLVVFKLAGFSGFSIDRSGGVFRVIPILGSGFIQDPTLFIQFVITGLQLGFVYALIALGYTMVYGIVKLINFAHGDVFMVGAFTSFYAVARFNLHRWPEAVFPALPQLVADVIGTLTVVILSMIVCALLAIVIERVAYKPLRDAPRIAALITAIGVSFFLE